MLTEPEAYSALLGWALAREATPLGRWLGSGPLAERLRPAAAAAPPEFREAFLACVHEHIAMLLTMAPGRSGGAGALARSAAAGAAAATGAGAAAAGAALPPRPAAQPAPVRRMAPARVAAQPQPQPQPSGAWGGAAAGSAARPAPLFGQPASPASPPVSHMQALELHSSPPQAARPSAPGAGAGAPACALSDAAAAMARLHGHLIANGLVPSLVAEVDALLLLLLLAAPIGGGGGGACNAGAPAAPGAVGRARLLCCGASAVRYACKVFECSGRLAHGLGPVSAALGESARLQQAAPQLAAALRRLEQTAPQLRTDRAYEAGPGARA